MRLLERRTFPIPVLRRHIFAIPYQSIGDSLQAALMAVEAGEDDPGVLYQEYRAIRDLKVSYKTPLSVRISRRGPSKTLNREVAELRMAVQLERRFSRRELFTIFANRAWFGDGQVGVEAAWQHFFQKEPNQLQAGESALLAGLIRAPAYLSPFTHPDRALKRRNEVLDAMVEARAIGAAEGETAKASALGVVERSAQQRSPGLG
ncbi:MAG TPA: biosynthetic peptidoglycan transglycosylase [Candidatus Sulfotelmatobacter sp.]